jgi:hypothetical protein
VKEDNYVETYINKKERDAVLKSNDPKARSCFYTIRSDEGKYFAYSINRKKEISKKELEEDYEIYRDFDTLEDTQIRKLKAVAEWIRGGDISVINKYEETAHEIKGVEILPNGSIGITI